MWKHLGQDSSGVKSFEQRLEWSRVFSYRDSSGVESFDDNESSQVTENCDSSHYSSDHR
ncbi:UNVERIFIED_CONTAM: hypothetical protein FKN15_040095 [Acipenser sinensis]